MLNLAGSQVAESEAAIAAVCLATDQPFGLRIDRGAEAWIGPRGDGLTKQADWLVLDSDPCPEYTAWISRLESTGRKIWLEVVSEDEAECAIALGAAAIILKGHDGGGRVGDETTFVLSQRIPRLLGRLDGRSSELLVQGGIGLHSAGACFLAGADGIVLDSQLLLARESRVSGELRNFLGTLDGSESLVSGSGTRVTTPPKGTLAEPGLERDLPLGPDAAAAKGLAQRFVTVSGIVQAYCHHVNLAFRSAMDDPPLRSESPWCLEHGTRYPIAQGPMTRVSDTAEFAVAVADAG
ncbi:MAG TPA: hypothetical protein VIY86_13745, partial [Pirellulaceae bacterium]